MNEAARIDEYPEVEAAIKAGLVTLVADPAGPESAHKNTATTQADQATSLRRMVAAMDKPAPTVRVRSAPLVAIASGKGGVGKSTLALNLAIGSGRKTTLVDLDLGTANLDVLCSTAATARLDSELFQTGNPDLARLIVQTRFGFGLIPGASGVASAAMLDPQQRSRLLGAVRCLGKPGELTIADLGAGIGPSVIETVAASDLGVIVTTPDPASVADAYAIIKCVVRHRRDRRPLRMGLVVSMAPSRASGRETHARIDRVCRRFLGGSLPLLGVVRRDERVIQATRRREPLLARRSNGPARRDLRSISTLIGMLAPRAGLNSGV